MMVIAVGLSSYNIALFHLVNHAFYKGLLFLGAGAVIHAVADNQDFRKYGGLIAFLPLSYSVMLIASLSLVAFPFMTGFYSKDFILESAYGQFHFSSVVVYFIATIGAMFTTLYSVKVLYLTFLTNANGPLINYKKAHEGDVFMSLPLIILAVFSIFFGYITKDMFIGMASGFFSDNSLFTHPLHEIMLETEFAVPTLFKLLPFFLTVTLSALSLILCEFLPKWLIYFKLTRMGYNTFSFFNQRFLIELFYNRYITRFILKLGGQTTKVLDKGSIELLGPYGLEKGLLKLSKSLSSLDTGVVTSYALYILIGLISYILIPYISLKDISILLCILFGVLNISINTLYLGVTNNTANGYAFTSLSLQSNLLGAWLKQFIVNIKKGWIIFLFAVFMYLSFKLPFKFLFENLNWTWAYPFFNATFSCLGVVVVTGLKDQNLKLVRLAIVGIYSLILSIFFLYLSYNSEIYKGAYESLAILLGITISLELPNILCAVERPTGGGSSASGSASGTQASNSSGNTTGENKGKNLGSPYIKQECLDCGSFGIKVPAPPNIHCILCGWARNKNGKKIHKDSNLEFQSGRLKFIASRRDIQIQIIKSDHERLKDIINTMRNSSEFASRMVPPIKQPLETETLKTTPWPKVGGQRGVLLPTVEDLPSIDSLDLNSDKDSARLGSDKNIDQSKEKNKQVASVDQSSSSQNTVVQSPPSEDIRTRGLPKTTASVYSPPHICSDDNCRYKYKGKNS